MTTNSAAPSDAPATSGPMSKIYGVLMYLTSQGAVLVWALFLCNVGLFAIDGDGSAAPSTAWAVDIGLILLFGVQHSVMARGRFKERITRIVPAHLERSTFVGTSGLMVLAMAALWQPLPEMVYQVDGGAARIALWVVYGVGWAIVVVSTMLIDDKALNGLRQSFTGNPADTTNSLMTPSLYKLVRHPMMLGFLIVFWASPDMTQGRLLVAGAMTAYVLIGMRFEERALLHHFGSEYEDYQKRVPMILPWPR